MNIQIGNTEVGSGQPCFVIAEIGINHNGDLDTACRLIDVAVNAGCQMVKFQKRTVETVFSQEELDKPREAPGCTTNGEWKRKLEFEKPHGPGSLEAFQLIDQHCKEKGILWTASPWDVDSVDFLEQFNLPCYKVASACVTHIPLLQRMKKTGKPVIMSTGLSTAEQVQAAIGCFTDTQLVLLHCVGTYPTEDADIQLGQIAELKQLWSDRAVIGYSGHERGIATTVAAVALGASVVERHITLDHTMYGSDQAASLEPQGFGRLVRDIRAVETALSGTATRPLPAEIPIANKLRYWR